MSAKLEDITKPKTESLLADTQAGKLETPEERDPGIFSLWHTRHLIALMVRRDLLGRFRGSMIGTFWAVINPLGHLLLYTFVFSIILGVRLGHAAGTGNFALYLMAGLLPWQALSEPILRSASVIHENPNLVKRVVFPLEILPLVPVLSSLTTEFIALSLFSVVAIGYFHTFHWTILYVPLVIFSQLLLVSGISWLMGSLGVFLQDIKHAMALFLSVWMYATPIVYPASMLAERVPILLWINPMAGIVQDYRRVMLDGAPPDWHSYFVYTSVAVIVFFVGWTFFAKTKRAFIDVM